MKPPETRERCRSDYGVLGLPLREISARRGVSERTLSTWRKESAGTEQDWDLLREQLVKLDSSLSKELMELSVATARHIRQTLNDDHAPGKDQVMALKRLLDSVNAARRAEREATPEKDTTPDQRTPAEKMQQIMAVVDKAFGMKPKAKP